MGVNENFNNNHDHHGCVDDDEIPLPGFRFHPTDEDLVSFYLQRKLHKKPISIDLINQIDIYKYDPWDLPTLFYASISLQRIPNRLVAVKKVLGMPCFDMMDDLNDESGFSHAPDNLTYGVDMKQIRWQVGACILAVYLALLYGMYVPDWQFTVHNPDSIYNGTINYG
ncbi:hypothetical protein VIGAN_03189000 [Vigna angularis var. angularis]|uniref:NAC domain-containing protein n=1 Tax=Vigna angularis var. angularis TaxID=157739 RepID=A0A0S3RMZ2_PHAAN|nr:hypothetical protein VIGAN_03189000 [Vigna angularis var. angularis]